MRRLALLLMACVAVVLAAGGCARKMPAPRTTVTLAVLDGVMAEGRHETRRSQAGWWFSARNRFDNGQAGVQLGEALAREFRDMAGVEVFPRSELRAYMAQKERILARQLPDLTPQQRLAVLEAQDPLDYGRSLNVDYVLTTRVDESRTIHNMVFNWWSSRVRFELSLWDVERGQVVWQWVGKDSATFRSQLAVMERLARKARREAERYDTLRVT